MHVHKYNQICIDYGSIFMGLITINPSVDEDRGKLFLNFFYHFVCKKYVITKKINEWRLNNKPCEHSLVEIFKYFTKKKFVSKTF